MTSRTNVEWARLYARNGWKVFPIHNMKDGCCSCGKSCGRDAGKHPSIAGGCNSATTDQNKVQEWWSKWPDANIGIATGNASQLFVLDIDPDKDGNESLVELERKIGKLPLTLEAETGGGGRHKYFSLPHNVDITMGQNLNGLRGIDFRCNGGYVVAPPSNHKRGGNYRWLPVYCNGQKIKMVSLPENLERFCPKGKQGKPCIEKPKVVAIASCEATSVPAAYSKSTSTHGAIESTEYPPSKIDPIIEGCAWLRHCRDDSQTLSEEEWYAALSILGRCENGKALAHEWSKAYPGYTEGETEKKLNHARNDGGPRTCDDIKRRRWGNYCDECTHDIKSPIILGLSSGGKSESIKWPVLAEEALYGLAGDIVRTIEPHSEADPVALLVQLLVAVGIAIGKNPFFEAEADRHRVNLFALLVGRTSKSRKGTSYGYIRRLIKEVEPDWQKLESSGLSTGEGLIWAVRNPTEKQEPIREGKSIIGYQAVVVDQGVADKRLLVQEAEFASTLRVLSRDGNTLSAVVRDAWDKDTLRIKNKNSPAEATDAHIGIIGHITADELKQYLSRTEAGNGFANRFLFFCVKRSKSLPEGGNLKPHDLAPHRERLAKALSFAKKAGQMVRDEESRRIWCAVYDDLAEGKLGLFGAVTARAEAQVLRLSCLYALLDESLIVGKPHLTAALALWEYAESSARFIFGDALGDSTADEILTALRAHPDGMTRTEIRDFFGKNRRADEITRALSLLAEHGMASFQTKADTGGRPAERWIATVRKAKSTTETT